MIKINNFLNKPLNKFILWLIIGLLIILVGIFPVKADTYNLSYADVQQYYDNYGSSLISITSTWNESLQSYISNNIYTEPNTFGGAVSFNSPISLINGHTYTLSIYFDQRKNITVSSKPNIAIGYSLANASSNYTSGNYKVSLLSYMVANNSTLQYVFKANSNATYIFLPFTTTYSVSQDYNMTQVVIDDLGASGVTQYEINSSLNNQTNIINNSITNTENNLKNAINQSTEDISNSIDLSNYNCMKETTKKDFHFGKGKYIENNGTLKPASTYYYTTDFIRVTGSTITFSGINGNNYHLTFFDKDYNIIVAGSILTSSTYKLPSGTYYIKFSLNKDNYNNFTLSSDSCIYVDKNISTDNAINDVNDTLNNDDVDSSKTTSTLEDLSEDLPTNSVISDLLLLPVRLFQNVVNSINGSCSSFNLGSLYGSNLTLPCINIESLIGSTLWSVIDILFCGAFILVIRKKFVDIFHNLTDLRNGGNAVE